jgi:hypothetical protein
MADGGDLAVPRRADTNALDRGGTVRGVVEHQGTLQRYLHRPSGCTRPKWGCTRPKCCEQRVGTREQLSAEAAADERRVEANIFLGYAKSLGHIGGIPGNHLVQLPGVGFSDELHRQTEMSA